MRKLLVLVALCAIPAFAQFDRYAIIHESSVSSTSLVITIQQPATNAKRIEIESVSVQCEVNACNSQVFRDGAPQTTGLISTTSLNVDTAPAGGPKFSVYATSALGFGAIPISPNWRIPADGLLPLQWTGTFKEKTATSQTFSVRVGPFTGTARVQIYVREYR